MPWPRSLACALLVVAAGCAPQQATYRPSEGSAPPSPTAPAAYLGCPGTLVLRGTVRSPPQVVCTRGIPQRCRSGGGTITNVFMTLEHGAAVSAAHIAAQLDDGRNCERFFGTAPPGEYALAIFNQGQWAVFGGRLPEGGDVGSVVVAPDVPYADRVVRCFAGVVPDDSPTTRLHICAGPALR